MLVFEEREKPEYPEKNLLEPWKKDQQQSQPIYGVHASIGTLASLVAGECSHPWTILVHSWPLTSAKMLLLFTRPKSLIWSFLSLKLRYPALYSICSSGAGFIAACNHNYTLFLFNCQLRILWCHSPYATAELFDELKVSAPLFLWTLIFQWTAV